MISIVLTFGAPVIDPLGNRPRNTSDETDAGVEHRRHGRREVPDGLVALDLEDVGPGDRAGPADAPEVVAQEIHDHRVLGAVLRGGQETLRDGAILRRPPAPRGGPLHRPGHDRAVAELEEQLGRGGEHAVAAEVEVGRVRPALGVAEVSVETPRIALHAGAQAHRVVDLVGVAGRDQLPDPADRRLVPLARGRRHPRVRRQPPGGPRRGGAGASSPRRARTSRTTPGATRRTRPRDPASRTTRAGSRPGAAS